MKIKVRHTSEVEESELLWWLPNRGTVKFALARRQPNIGDAAYVREGAGSDFCREVEIVPSQPAVSEELGFAIRMLGRFTVGNFKVSMLSGPFNATRRQHLLKTLRGRAAQSSAGINALRDEYYSQAGIPPGSLAAQEEAFASFCKVFVAEGGAK